MKRIKSLVTLLIFAISANAFPFVGSTRELVMLSEYGDNETILSTLARSYDGTFQPNGLGAASDILLTALYQDVPVFTPAALWNTIVQHKQLFDAMATNSVHDLKKQYGTTSLFAKTATIKTFKEQCVYARKLHDRFIKHLRANNTKQTFKYALKHDALYNELSAPASLRHADWTCWEHIMQYLMCSIVPVERFTIFTLMLKDAPDCPFLLFLPKTALKTMPNTSAKTVSGLTQREINLGLKIDHCTELTQPFNCLETSFNDTQLDLMPQACNALFVHKHEVTQSERQTWCLYMMGHGVYDQVAKDRLKTINTIQKRLKKNYAMALDTQTKETLKQQIDAYESERALLRLNNIVLGMPLDTARRFFTFLEKEIITKAFLFTSCSSGGQQAIDTFKNADGSPLQLSYPVITDTLAEAPLLRAIPHLAFHNFDCTQPTNCPLDIEHLVDWETKTIILDTPYDFELLFKLAREKQITPETMDLMLRAFAPTHACKTHGTMLQSAAVPATIRKQCKRLLTSECCLHTNNHCAIRFPGAKTFSLVGPAQMINEKQSAATTPLLMLTQENTAPITIKKQNTTAPCPALVSAIPGKARHMIDMVHAPDYTLTDIITALSSCEELLVPKCFCIKQLTCRDNCLECTNKICTCTNLYCFISSGADQDDQTPVNHVIATHGARTYHHCWEFDKPFSDNGYALFDIIGDGQEYATRLMQPFAEHKNSCKQFIGSVVDTGEVLYQVRSLLR